MGMRQGDTQSRHHIPILFMITLLIGFSLRSSVAGPGQLVSPQTHKLYTADILNDDFEARVGEPFFLLLGLTPETLPPGYTVSTLVDVLEAPEGAKPEIVTGFPKIRIRLRQAGTYRLAIRVSLMSKSSCGGIDAREILRKGVQLQAAEL